MDQDNLESVEVEYRRRLAGHLQRFAGLDKAHNRYGSAKVALLFVSVGVGWLAFGEGFFSAFWILVPVCALVILAVAHEKLIVRRARAQRAVKLYKDAIDRVAGNWAGRGSSGARFRSSDHPYSEDLDLFGFSSLFELLCAARTRSGEDRLAEWFKSPGAIKDLQNRQTAVEELKHRLDLREEMALFGAETAESTNLHRLAKWAGEPVAAPSPLVGYTAVTITILTVWAVVYKAFGNTAVPLEMAIIAGQCFAFSRRKADAISTRGVDSSVRDLAVLAEMLIRLERENFASPALSALKQQLSEEGEPPSRSIARLVRIVAWKDALRNNVFVLVGMPLLWSTHCALALGRWRRAHGSRVPVWIEAVATFEALSSLSRFAYENPETVFPELIENEAVFEAIEVKHPLLPKASVVTNTISIDKSARLYIVSGSNMSGKSTLLRTIGINTVLALAGAPVCAEAMRIGPLHVGASLRAGDSLQGGISRFYGEILRLRRIVEIAKESPPALFLLDEILHGTNSHDRTVGAEAVLRALLQVGAIGLVTTHDLALARIAEDPALNAVNVHFQDDMVDGKMHFDYHLRGGIVTKSNAIPLMRAVGLEV